MTLTAEFSATATVRNVLSRWISSQHLLCFEVTTEKTCWNALDAHNGKVHKLGPNARRRFVAGDMQLGDASEHGREA